jgi:hypothetical protein
MVKRHHYIISTHMMKTKKLADIARSAISKDKTVSIALGNKLNLIILPESNPYPRPFNAAFRFANSLARLIRFTTPVNPILTSEFLGKAFVSSKS